ncbi:helix-turn-helix domain-containing protein [Brevibacillus ruminantium]|uniref:Helix-turn-helix domain-containing protein n=1 Tax=Brevibacillus ruminantium TaxID=2950604 RepID=A0ABY4WM20_9BACL|nr:helix-turn-helix transcriptional regulator [Brevibacillus ruminantium]USG66424.1 helix-turn-helix domain-containing protein [Brevibacillus ruminantium]
MEESVSTLQFTTIGDVIKRYREQANLSITQLANMSGVHKGVISKIELGDTKRPELRTIKAIAHVLEIPYQEIVEHYIDVEKRVEALKELLMEAVEFSNEPLVSKVALKLLESPQEDTYNAIKQLYLLTENLADTAFKLMLYKIIARYARERGVPPYVAKSLLQIYLIERLDLKQMEESFKAGEEILHYVDFLSQEERIIYYFRMGLQAFAIKRYKQCIELCEAGLALETTQTELKARAYLAMINSYLLTENYEAVESHLVFYELLDYSFVKESAKLTRAIVKARKKEYNIAIPMLKSCLEEISEHARIHVINELLRVYFEVGDTELISELLTKEEQYLVFDAKTPYKHSSLGEYFKYKGNFYFNTGKFDEGVTSYLNSMLAYGRINDHEEITKCMSDLIASYVSYGKGIDALSTQKLKQVYNELIDSSP